MIENFYPNPLLVGRLVHASLERKGLAFEKNDANKVGIQEATGPMTS